MPLFSCAGTRPNNLGVKDSRLAPCPSSPNCVSSDDADAAHPIGSLQLVVAAGTGLAGGARGRCRVAADQDHHADR